MPVHRKHGAPEGPFISHRKSEKITPAPIRGAIHANFIAFLAQGSKLKKSLTHLSVAV
jgi:hypothetical protein